MKPEPILDVIFVPGGTEPTKVYYSDRSYFFSNE